jgi:hypothetical protein
MAGTATVVRVGDTSNVWIEGLLWGTRWDSPGPGTVIDVHIATSGIFGPFETEATAPTAAERAAIEAALAAFEAVCDIDFVMVASPAQADIVWAIENVPDATYFGFALPPGTWVNPELRDWQALVVVNAATTVVPGGSPGALGLGSFDYVTYIHELGHALGLAHPHDRGGTSVLFPGVTGPDDPGDHAMNQGVFTTMTYLDGWVTAPHGQSPNPLWGYQAGPMALDIAALQALYGPNLTHRTGDDSYLLPGANAPGTAYLCIWDAGGTDTLVAPDLRSVIDLRAATLEEAPGGGGFLSFAEGIHGGFTIAHGVVIENAAGGAAADRLRGNQAANELRGNAGDDTLVGAAGADELRGGNGRDAVAYGGANGVSVALDGSLAATGHAAGDDFRSIEDLIGSGGDDHLRGDGAANRLGGAGGDDLLEGGAGEDRLEGGDGDDRLRGNSGADLLIGGAGADEFLFGARDSAPGARDSIADFAPGADRIVVRGIDPSAEPGDQALRLDLDGDFGQGEIRQTQLGRDLLVEANLDGDAAAELAILLQGVAQPLGAADFLL